MMRSTPATIDASSVTSIANGMMPRDSSAAMRSTRRATAYTVHPDSTRWMAMDSPMPDDAPVTRATLVIPTPYAASPGSRREATSGRLDAVERPALVVRTGLSMCRRRPQVASRRFRSGCGARSAHRGLGLLGDPGVLPVDEVGGGEVVTDGGEEADVHRLVALGDGRLDGRHDRAGVPLGHRRGELALEGLVEDATGQLGPGRDLHGEPLGLGGQRG